MANPIQEALDFILKKVKEISDNQAEWGWGEVTQLNPLLVWVEGDPEPIGVRSATLSGGIQLGSRVWTQKFGGQVIIMGVANDPLFITGYAGHALDGTPRQGPMPLIIQSGSVAQTSDAAGFARVTWPVPFPNGLLSVQLTNGDTWTAPATTLGPAGSPSPWGAEGQGTKVSCVYRTMNSTTGQATVNNLHRCDWLAVGW